MHLADVSCYPVKLIYVWLICSAVVSRKLCLPVSSNVKLAPL